MQVREMFIVVYVFCFTLYWVVGGTVTYRSDVYPKVVPVVEVRRDKWTNKSVTSGLFKKIKKTSLAKFRRKLQCSATEPNLNFNTGMISAFRLAPLSLDAVRYFCSYRETRNPRSLCNERSCHWYKDWATRYERGEYKNSSDFNFLNIWSLTLILIQVKGGELYYDWPWGAHRYDLAEATKQSPILPLLKGTIKHISDVGDSVFFVGGESPSMMKYNEIPVPTLSHTTGETLLDLIFPWKAAWRTANDLSKRFKKQRLPYTEASYKLLEPGYREWDQRVEKAALFASMFRERQFMFDIARRHPDLFDASFRSETLCFEPWNPMSKERCPNNEYYYTTKPGKARVANGPPGYYAPLRNISCEQGYTPAAYKYVIVPIGSGPGVSLSTSSRIQHILATSGAVVLLQRNTYKFHFSAQFKPWVHYVPLSYSGADVLEKVMWLREHDDLARQIAENGRSFARSYLRLEDFYCYAASVLSAMAEIGKMTNVTQIMFDPRKY